MKLKKFIEIEMRIPEEYVPPNHHHISGDILISIYDTNWDQEKK